MLENAILETISNPRDIPIKYRNVNPNEYWVKYHLSEIELIPKGLQRFLAQKGVSIIFYRGDCTDQPELSLWKDKKSLNGKLFNFYSSMYSQKKIFLKNSSCIGDMLHELGHGVDYTLKKISQFPVIKSLAKKKGILITQYYLWHVFKDDFNQEIIQKFQQLNFYKNSEELFAQSFAMYFHNLATNQMLKKISPEIFQLLTYIERISENSK